LYILDPREGPSLANPRRLVDSGPETKRTEAEVPQSNASLTVDVKSPFLGTLELNK